MLPPVLSSKPLNTRSIQNPSPQTAKCAAIAAVLAKDPIETKKAPAEQGMGFRLETYILRRYLKE